MRKRNTGAFIYKLLNASREYFWITVLLNNRGIVLKIRLESPTKIGSRLPLKRGCNARVSGFRVGHFYSHQTRVCGHLKLGVSWRARVMEINQYVIHAYLGAICCAFNRFRLVCTKFVFVYWRFVQVLVDSYIIHTILQNSTQSNVHCDQYSKTVSFTIRPCKKNPNSRLGFFDKKPMFTKPN